LGVVENDAPGVLTTPGRLCAVARCARPDPAERDVPVYARVLRIARSYISTAAAAAAIATGRKVEERSCRRCWWRHGCGRVSWAICTKDFSCRGRQSWCVRGRRCRRIGGLGGGASDAIVWLECSSTAAQPIIRAATIVGGGGIMRRLCRARGWAARQRAPKYNKLSVAVLT